MDEARAQELLANERTRLERLLRAEIAATAPDQGDEVDDANWRIAEETGRAVSRSLRDRWSALERAEERLARGNYGLSLLSGKPIPDERLEADPLAELTVQEAASEAIRARFSPEPVSGLTSTRRTLAALAERDEAGDEEADVTAVEVEDDQTGEEGADEVDVADADLEVDELEGEELIDEEATFDDEEEEDTEEPHEEDKEEEHKEEEHKAEEHKAEARPRRGRRGR